MPGVLQNIILKQSINFQYNGKADGFALQKEVSDWCKFTLIPEIEQQLDAFSIADDYITIDKLVIDATIDKKDWQQQIRNELMLSLNKKLSDYQPRFKTAAFKNHTVSRKLDELILFYFEKGYLPWWGKALIKNDFKTVLHSWIKAVIPQATADHISIQLQHIITKPVIERIINQVTPPLYFQFLKNIFKSEAGLIDAAAVFFKEIIPVEMAAVKQAAIKKSVYSFMLNMLVKNQGKIDTPLLLSFFYEELKMQQTAAAILKPAAAKTAQINTPFKIAWQQLLIEENKIAATKISGTVKARGKLKYNKTIDNLTGPDADKILKTDTQILPPEGIYIENSGAVIIAAFLPNLFQKLKLSSNHSIVNSNLAAMMIQYAVSGKKIMAEHELVLPKILCGINLDLPVNTNTRLTANQIKDADEMLAAVIEYWAVIKNTSIAGLRESFLKRNGKLSLVDDEWLLQVEQKPYDMLLQQLPWSISMIKLPWMKNLLKTTWI
jgi:hypothetical protein